MVVNAHETKQFLIGLEEKGIFLSINENQKLISNSAAGAITPSIAQEIKARKEVIISLLKERQDKLAKTKSMVKAVQDRENLPLSFYQQSLWVADRYEGASVHYHIPVVLRAKGKVDPNALNFAFSEIVRRHEVLRTNYELRENGEPVQVIRQHVPFAVTLTDIRNQSEIQQQQFLDDYIESSIAKPFDLSNDLMLRAELVSKGDESHVLLVVMHHIASDAWSMSILIREFSALYNGFMAQTSCALQDLDVQYGDYAYWQRNDQAGERLKSQTSYWRETLAGLPVLHSLPTDKPRPAVQTFNGNIYRSQLPQSTFQRLTSLCQKHEATQFMGLHAAFSAFLARYSNETDIVIGTSIANREQTEVSELIGFFVNLLVLRSDLSESPGFSQLLTQSKELMLSAYEHQDLPFEQVVEAVKPERSLSHSPLFQVMLTTQKKESSQMELSGLTLELNSSEHTIAKYDLTLNLIEDGTDNSLEWEYNQDLFTVETIERMAGHFNRLLDSMLQNPQQNIFSLEWLSGQECQLLNTYGEGTKATYERCLTLYDKVNEWAIAKPDQLALVDNKCAVTYQQLKERVDRLSAFLTGEDIGPGSFVGIAIGNSLEMVISLLAVNRLGAAYIPLELSYPQQRLNYIIENAGIDIVLASEQALTTHHFDDLNLVLIDGADAEHWMQEYQQPCATDGQIGHAFSGDQLAYVLYTSGSTGQPKGVKIPHSALNNYLTHASDIYMRSDLAGAVVSSPLAFDATITTLLTPLVNGRSLHLLETDNDSLLNGLQHYLTQAEQNLLFKLTPAHLELGVAIFQEKVSCANSHQIVIGGEQLKVGAIASWRKHLPHSQFINEYGPTETVVGCSYKIIDDEAQLPGGMVSIGKAIQNTQLYVLDKIKQPVPVGVVGELYIGGAGVGEGYINRPEQSAERFINIDLPDISGQRRVYRSGDLAYFRSNGDLVFVSRCDMQVKIRGYRIEPGEIEAAINKDDAVAECAVIDRTQADGSAFLAAYIVPADRDLTGPEATAQQGLFIRGIREKISQLLPEYMVPESMVVLEALPLTVNGKIDKKSLPQSTCDGPVRETIAPRNENERVLLKLWSEVLLINEADFGVADSFFDLGGHSLKAIKALARINRHFGTNLSLKDFLTAQTISNLATILASSEDTGLPAIQPVSRELPLPLSFAQNRLWLIDQLTPGQHQYNIHIALNLQGDLSIDALQDAFNRIIERHESLRTCFRVNDDGVPFQHIKKLEKFEVDYTEFMSDDKALDKRNLSNWLIEKGRSTFDLTQDLMLRCNLAKVDEEQYILLVTMHHIASDGWSMSLLMKEFCHFYQANIEGVPAVMEPLEVQYADYAYWQQKYISGDVLNQQLAYWQEQLSDLPVAHSLPLDFSRPTQQSFRGQVIYSEVCHEAYKELERLCQAIGASLFVGLNAVFATLLSRYSNEKDIAIGSPIANREQLEISQLIGFFVNTLVLRNDLTDISSFKDLLLQSKQVVFDAYENQQVPFEQVVETVQPQRSTSHSPLFQVMLVLQNNDAVELSLPQLSISGLADEGEGIAKYDLTLTAVESPDGLQLGWEYNSDLFKAQTIETMARHFNALLTSMVRSPEADIFTLPMVPATEAQALLQVGREGDGAMDAQRLSPRLLHSKVLSQITATPDNIAVYSKERSVTYGELGQMSARLSEQLIKGGSQRNKLIAVVMEKGWQQVVSVLAILRAGGAYLPVDAHLPDERISTLLRLAEVSQVVTTAEFANTLLADTDYQLNLVDEQLLHQPVAA
ncbi:non-ribosomal peptide synthetase, partial [Planctobacterium marinum]